MLHNLYDLLLKLTVHYHAFRKFDNYSHTTNLSDIIPICDDKVKNFKQEHTKLLSAVEKLRSQLGTVPFCNFDLILYMFDNVFTPTITYEVLNSIYTKINDGWFYLILMNPDFTHSTITDADGQCLTPHERQHSIEFKTFYYEKSIIQKFSRIISSLHIYQHQFIGCSNGQHCLSIICDTIKENALLINNACIAEINHVSMLFHNQILIMLYNIVLEAKTARLPLFEESELICFDIIKTINTDPKLSKQKDSCDIARSMAKLHITKKL